MADLKLPPDARLAIFTVVSNNYLHFARTLLQTVARHHPEADVYCVIVDTDLGPPSEFSDEFSVLRMQDLDIPDLKRMSFQYDVLELNTAVKPWAFETLLRKGYENVIYLDPDIFVYRPMTHVTEALSSGFDIVITPHLLSPIRDDKKPTELDIRRAGTYNFGFCAVRQSENTLDFLRWWQGKLFRDCIVDQDRGIFVDQSWIDLVPGLFDRVCILRNPGYNIAYWNVAQRTVKQEPGGDWTVEGEPLVFFHFSGFNPLSPDSFSKHQDRFTLSSLGPAATLARNYASTLIENGASIFTKLPYGFSTFADGTRIPGAFRRAYLQNDTLRTRLGEDPFANSEFLVESAEGEGVVSIVPITWPMHFLYRRRQDLQARFNLLDPTQAVEFWDWFIADQSSELSDPLRELHRKKRMALHQQTLVEKDEEVLAWEVRCHEIFADLLGRNPTRLELDRLGRMCGSRLGASVALIIAARTTESRTLPRPTRRFKKAMRAIWTARKTPPGQPLRLREARHGQPRSTTGLYPPEPDAAHNGVWCTPHVSMPLGSGPHASIGISGIYLPSYLARTNGRATLGLDLLLDGQLWKRVVLPEGGEIEIEDAVPEHLSRATVLQIDADGSFVPAAIGEGDDQRDLSWRLKRVRAGDVTVFDCRRDQHLLPMSQFYRPQGFNLIGYVFAELGVGEAARTMARAAEAASIPYSLHDVGFQTNNRQEDRRAVEKAVSTTFGIDILYVNADQTPNTLQHLSQKGRSQADYRIGFWHWEQPRLPEIYWNGFDGLDEIWVPTAFVHEAISAVSPIPVFKVPHAVDFQVDNRWSRESFGIPARKFAVLVMYDFHSYRYRKNPEAAIAAFKLAARGRSDVVLVIKTINASKYPEDYAALKAEVANLDSVIFIDEVYSRAQIYALEASCDCMLSLHRAEGFGFGPAEMMFLGKPVIATGWSGNMEFMTQMNSFPVNYELKPLAVSLGAYAAGLDWAEADVDHAASCLRQVVEDQALARQIGERAQHTMRTKFSPDVIGRQYWDRLAVISMRL
jgi:glycosyltransferase involved in cell wall biosynthesis